MTASSWDTGDRVLVSRSLLQTGILSRLDKYDMTSIVTIAMVPETSTILDVPGLEGSSLDQQEFAVGTDRKEAIESVQASDLVQLSDEALLFRHFMDSGHGGRAFEILTG